MKKETNIKIIIIAVMFILFLCISLTGCNTPTQTEASAQDSGPTGATASEPATDSSSDATGKVQPGGWEASFSIDLANGKTENWIVDFHVDDDGKTVSSVELIHYIGVLTPDTNATALFTVIDAPIKKNSFDFSLTELVSYSTQTYKGSVTFTSSEEADGMLSISGDDYRFTAVPFTN